jgi:hypothetical protein
MEIRYRETRSDFIRWHRLNKTGVVARWRNYLLVAATLLPSAMVLFFLGSWYATLWVAVAMAVMLCFGVYRFFWPLVLFPMSQHVDSFEVKMAARTVSRSVTQWKWERIEEYRETRKDFQFWRLDFCSTVPKRALSAEQKQEQSELIAKVQQEPAGDSPPLPLFCERILGDGGYPVYQFQYRAADVSQILDSPLKPYRSVPASTIRRSRWRVWVQYAFLAFVSVFGCVAILRMVGQQNIVGSFLRDVLICAIPFFILPLIMRAYARFRKPRLFKLPSDEISVRLCPDGVAMGASDFISFVHWNDVTSLYTNDHFIGFRTIHHMIQIVPKRAIGEEAEVERFLKTAASLKEVADREAATVVQSEPVHSDNPYQAPMSQ